MTENESLIVYQTAQLLSSLNSIPKGFHRSISILRQTHLLVHLGAPIPPIIWLIDIFSQFFYWNDEMVLFFLNIIVYPLRVKKRRSKEKVSVIKKICLRVDSVWPKNRMNTWINIARSRSKSNVKTASRSIKCFTTSCSRKIDDMKK